MKKLFNSTCLVAVIILNIIVWTPVLTSCKEIKHKVTLTEKIVTSMKETPFDWVKIDNQSDFDKVRKTDTILAKSIVDPIYIMGDGVVNDVHLIGDVFYNRNCNMAVTISKGFYTYMKVISKSKVVELNQEEQDDILAAIDEINENIRLKKQEEILDEICK
jgi:hypothetical protein